MKQIKRRKYIFAAMAFTAAAFIAGGLHNPLSVSEISLSSDKIKKTVRIALVSDLHSCKYGDSQKILVDTISNQSPDIVCFTGDIFDDRISGENAEVFISEISAKYPCYYVTGNHEFRIEEAEFNGKMAFLDKCGVFRLENESREISVNGQIINIIGVDDPESCSFDLSFIETINKDCYSILLSHRPEYFGDYARVGVDLALCGHAHGGQWRIPGILNNGLLAPNQGLFPKYTSGLFSKADTNMVVSRGLAKESTIVPRFYNRPEIVIVEIQ